MTSGGLELGLSELWQLDPDIVFLNHGTFGASPRAVLDHQTELRAIMESDPVNFIDGTGRELWAEAITRLSGFLNADPDGMAFVANATTGVNTVLSSLDIGTGDEVVVTDTTYQACRNAVDHHSSIKGFVVKVANIPVPLTSKHEAIDAVLSQVGNNTKLALIDTVSSPTGIRLPFEELVEILNGRGVDTLLDAAHGPGLIPLDISRLNAAFVTGNCHKWLCTPKGSAFLHARSDKLHIRPLVISHGATLPERLGPRFRLEFDWTGTIDPTPWMCIPFAIDHLGSLFEGGWDEIISRNHQMALAARTLIAERVGLQPVCSEEFITSMAAFIIPGSPHHPDPDPLHELLYRAHGIQVPVQGWSNHAARYLRISSHLYNDLGQYRRLSEALIHELG